MRELAELVQTGPDMEVDGVVRWRRIDLQRVIEERFGVAYNEPPRVYRRVFCSNVRRLYQGRSCLHRRPPLLLAV